MIEKMRKLMPYALTLILLSLVGCTAERLSESSRTPAVPAGEVGDGVVAFSLPRETGGLRAVTTPIPALERESAVNPNQLFAVFFDTKGNYVRTVQARPERGSTIKYTAETGLEGDYTMHLVANADADLERALYHDLVRLADLQKVIVTRTLGRDDTATGFVMLSPEAAAVTGLGANKSVEIAAPILLERLAARFDVYNTIPGLALTKVTLEGAQSLSYLANSGSNVPYGPNPVYPAPVYRFPQAGMMLKGHMYSYENNTPGDLHLRLEGIYYEGQRITEGVTLTGGVPVTLRLEIKDTDGTLLPVKRNHLYSFYLKEAPDDGGGVTPNPKPDGIRWAARLVVKDWQNGGILMELDSEALAKEGGTDETPYDPNRDEHL